jgi:hypothetical protein
LRVEKAGTQQKTSSGNAAKMSKKAESGGQ